MPALDELGVDLLRQVLAEEGTHLLAKRVLLRREAQIHGGLLNGPHAEVPGEAGPRSTRVISGASFEARLSEHLRMRWAGAGSAITTRGALGLAPWRAPRLAARPST